jgi:superfamily II DNA or RNA helicase
MILTMDLRKDACGLCNGTGFLVKPMRGCARCGGCGFKRKRAPVERRPRLRGRRRKSAARPSRGARSTDRTTDSPSRPLCAITRGARMLFVTVDSRIRIPLEGLSEEASTRLRKSTSHTNPDFAKQRAMGRFYTKVPPEICTWRIEGSDLTLPSGAMGRVRRILAELKIPFSLVDARTEGLVVNARAGLKYRGHTLRLQQEEMIAKAFAKERCVVRAATGSGKTEAALALAAKIGLNCLVVLPNAKLLQQWQKRAIHAFKIKPDQVGIIRGAKRKLRPITLATQQTLWSRTVDAELQEFFGAVIVDEAHHCFDGGTPVLMIDGTHKAIRDIVVGDHTAVGGRVRSLFKRAYEGPLYRLGEGALVTPEHPIATSDGWRTVESLDNSSYVYYDPLHAERVPTMPGMQQDVATRLLRRTMLAMSSVFQRGRRLHLLRELRLAVLARRSSIVQVRDHGPVERGAHGGDFGDRALHCRSATWLEDAECEQEAPSTVAGSRAFGDAAERSVARAEGALRETGGARGGERGDAKGDSRGQGTSLWGSQARQRIEGSSDRAEAFQDVGASRLRDAHGCDNGGAGAVSETLQDRSDARGSDDRGGDRRFESYEQSGSGRTEDLLPRIEGVVGSSIPGSVRLRQGRAGVHRLTCEAAINVYNIETEEGVYVAGGVLVHNCAARTFVQTLDKFPARYRIGFSADERRKDRKEFITYDLIGEVAHEVSREECEASGAIVDVEIRVVLTGFAFNYDGDFNALLDAMTVDEGRNAIVLDIALREMAEAKEQVIMLTHRREHARAIDRTLIAHGIKSGCLLGAQEAGDEEEFTQMCAKLLDGSARAGVGTYPALGEGIDLPAVSVGIAMTPIATNKQLFNQVRGRLCRASEKTGKTSGRLYVLYDPKVFDERVLRNIVMWNRTVNVRVGDTWISGKDFLRRNRKAS